MNDNNKNLKKKIVLIMNPTSQSGRGKKKWEIIFNTLNLYSDSICYEVQESKFVRHAIELSYAAGLCNDVDVIASVGGDGTINEVLSGLSKAYYQKGTTPLFGILYTGTSPDICKYHNIPLDMEKAVKLIIDTCLQKRTIQSVDVGEINFLRDNEKCRSWFLCSVNLGIGPSVANGSNSGLRKYLGDFLGTLISLIISVLRYKNTTFNCVINGKQTIMKDVLNLTIGKNPYIASGIKINADIKHDDGKMYIFSVNNFSILKLLFYLPQIYNGKFVNHSNNYFSYIDNFECLSVETGGHDEVEFDGDAQGKLPCNIKILHQVLRIVK